MDPRARHQAIKGRGVVLQPSRGRKGSDEPHRVAGVQEIAGGAQLRVMRCHLGRLDMQTHQGGHGFGVRPGRCGDSERAEKRLAHRRVQSAARALDSSGNEEGDAGGQGLGCFNGVHLEKNTTQVQGWSLLQSFFFCSTGHPFFLCVRTPLSRVL